MIFAKINFTRCKLVTIINQQFQWWLDFLILDFIWWVSTFQDIDNVTEKPSPYSVLLPVCCEGWCPGPRSLSLSNTTETPRPVLLEKGFMGLTWTIEQLKITDNDNVSTSYVFYFFQPITNSSSSSQSPQCGVLLIRLVTFPTQNSTQSRGLGKYLLIIIVYKRLTCLFLGAILWD